MEKKAALMMGLVVCMCSYVLADWTVVYSEDFSSDPGWTTNAPDQMYWDNSSQSYHLESWDTGNQYVYVPISYNKNYSYKLAYDIEVKGVDWAGDVRFGLGDADMDTFDSATWRANYARGDGGRGALVRYWSDTSGGDLDPVSYAFLYDLDTFYHNVLAYDRPTQTLSWEVTRISDGTVVYQISKSGVGIFSGIDRLYSSSIGDNYASGATGEGYIDNVILSYQVPEPATLLLLGIGGLFLRKKKI